MMVNKNKFKKNRTIKMLESDKKLINLIEEENHKNIQSIKKGGGEKKKKNFYF